MKSANINSIILVANRNIIIIILSIQCHRGQSLNAFFDGIQSGPVKLAVVGCGCSIATEPVAEISHQWNISQVTSVDANQ